MSHSHNDATTEIAAFVVATISLIVSMISLSVSIIAIRFKNFKAKPQLDGVSNKMKTEISFGVQSDATVRVRATFLKHDDEKGLGTRLWTGEKQILEVLQHKHGFLQKIDQSFPNRLSGIHGSYLSCGPISYLKDDRAETLFCLRPANFNLLEFDAESHIPKAREFMKPFHYIIVTKEFDYRETTRVYDIPLGGEPATEVTGKRRSDYINEYIMHPTPPSHDDEAQESAIAC